MGIKFRYQNPVINDTIRLGFDVYNSNLLTDPTSIEKVDIYFLDPTARQESNPDGRVLFTTIAPSNVIRDAEGRYHVDVPLTPPQFVIGNFLDIWHVQFRSDEPVGEVEQSFGVYPDLWITSPIPIVYDFQFRFTPSRLRLGEKKFIQCEIMPQVPRQSDLVRYYHNLAIAADIYVSIALNCGECVPEEEDLRLIIDEAPMEYKEKGVAYYKIDTSEMECGIYDIWAKMTFGDNVYVSEIQQIQIYS
jgi:hypothetical protein